MVTTPSTNPGAAIASSAPRASLGKNPVSDALAALVPWLASAGQSDLNAQLYEYLSPLDRAEFNAKHSNLTTAFGMPNGTKGEKGARSAAIGKAFEELVIAMLKGSAAISYQANIRTAVAEIDFLLAILPFGSCIPMLRQHGTHILGEAKCYTTGPKTEWITELAGLMDAHSANLSILFVGSKQGKLQREVRVAIALTAAKGKVVVPFGKTQIARVEKGENFLKILCEQYVDAINHSALLWI